MRIVTLTLAAALAATSGTALAAGSSPAPKSPFVSSEV